MAFVNVSKVETWDGFYLWANHDIFFMFIFVLFSFRFQWQIYSLLGGSPVGVVNGWDLQSEGSEFKSRRRILDRHFSHLFVVRIAMFVWKDENKHKIGRGWPIFLKKYSLTYLYKLKKQRCCAWYWNPLPLDGRRWRFHWAMATFFVGTATKLVILPPHIPWIEHGGGILFFSKKRRWSAWDLNPGPQNGRRRRNHRAMAATLVVYCWV